MSILKLSVLFTAVSATITFPSMGWVAFEVEPSNPEETIVQYKRKRNSPWRRGGGRREILRFFDNQETMDC
ncbi:hypothetical protein IQ249_24230 [Lusitaniella coriacea LEGE 07157]|uniref:Secreted protein n=1 Tax=Lusitaniella coriacea LEGE 07157 TaxID=945747 RepID=A0A8J7E0E1_9CYAN|nr:hypothetical protein [Lusitaniella coriacea]MBE9119002.1 hypothetical protein [Lusitaniella coriacea LEGE 07157]